MLGGCSQVMMAIQLYPEVALMLAMSSVPLEKKRVRYTTNTL